MPRRHFVPLLFREAPRQNHLHAAITRWFDWGAATTHDSHAKPYTISPPTVVDDLAGVLITTFSDDADAVLEQVATKRPSLVLGRQGEVLVGVPRVLLERSWEQIAAATPPATGTWRVDFHTPTQFRTGKHFGLLPTPQLVLGAALNECGHYAPDALPSKSDRPLHQLLVADVDLATERYSFGDITYVGFVGHATYRAPSREVATAVAPLFAALPFVGAGSYRVRGLGCVDVAPLQIARPNHVLVRRSA